jgi:ferritin-like metal-binding protein YciE
VLHAIAAAALARETVTATLKAVRVAFIVHGCARRFQMGTVVSLREHLVEELNDLLDAEQQLIEALPQMAQRAASRELKAAFKTHLAETRTHQRRVSQALRQLGEKPDGSTCEAMEGLIEEGEHLMKSGQPGALQDAMLITAAQKVEHYEIASYGTVRTYAQVVGERAIAKLMQQTLKEEKAADKKLSGIAERSINKRAGEEWEDRTGVGSMLPRGTRWAGTIAGSAVKRLKLRAHAADRAQARRPIRRFGRSRARKR